MRKKKHKLLLEKLGRFEKKEDKPSPPKNNKLVRPCVNILQGEEGECLQPSLYFFLTLKIWVVILTNFKDVFFSTQLKV